MTIEDVSVTPETSISTAAGGLMLLAAGRQSEAYGMCAIYFCVTNNSAIRMTRLERQ